MLYERLLAAADKKDESLEPDCWIFGDESGLLGVDRFFSIGIVGTRHPKQVIKILREIRERTEYFGEVSYKSNNHRRVLCCIRWMDWFFSGQDLAHFKIIIKDAREFDVSYYRGNKYDAGAVQLAYCETYREVLNNFACYGSDRKGLISSHIGLQKMSIEQHVAGKIPGLLRKWCLSKSSTEKKNDGAYTGAAEMLQLCDLITSSSRGLCCSIFGEDISNWSKNALRKNIHYHVPQFKTLVADNKNVYHPSFTPLDKQTFVVYKWKGGKKRQSAPILLRR
jgi:hypothetical protein